MQAQFLNSPFLIASQEYCTYFLFPPFLVSSAVISSSFLRQSMLFSSPLCGRCHSQAFSLPVLLLQFTVVPLSPTLTLFEERVGGVESVTCTGTCVPSVQTGGHFLFPRPTPYLVVSYHREHDINRFSCYSVSYRSSSFERNFLRLISYFFKNLRLNFLQRGFL